MPNDNITISGLANMLGCAFYSIGKQNKSGGSFNGVDWVNKIQSLAETVLLRYPPGTTKLFNGTSSGMSVFGSTNAPVLISGTLGVLGEEGLVVSTTLAKCVGTATLGGEPMTSCVC